MTPKPEGEVLSEPWNLLRVLVFTCMSWNRGLTQGAWEGNVVRPQGIQEGKEEKH